MKPSTYSTLACTLVVTTLVRSQEFSITESLNAFGLNLLRETAQEGGDSLNIALSTYTVWTLMTIISEGARDNTARQLESTLKIPADKTPVRISFQNLSSILQAKSGGVRLDLNTAIFANQDFPVKKGFQSISEDFYDVRVNPLNFKNPVQAASLINKYVAEATKNRISTFVSAEDMENAQVFITSILYFKGIWNMPFNTSATQTESFSDEKNNKIGDVNMMFQIGAFPYYRNEEINAHALELPYGLDNKMSMVLVLPFKGTNLSNLLNSMSQVPFSTILDKLTAAKRQYRDDEVYVYIPRFKISSDFNLNIVLNKIGIKDVFDVSRANLLGMFDHYLYLSRLIQKAEIEVNEEGTTASAATGASIIDRSIPPTFRANRPFLYFIVDKPTKCIIFSGKVSNPNTLK